MDVNEFAAYISTEPDLIDSARLEVLSREARALIRAYCASLPEDSALWPESASVVLLRVVARGYDRPDKPGISSQALTAGPFQQSFGFDSETTSGALYLTKQDKAILDGRKKGGAYSIDQLPLDTKNNGSPGYRNSEWLRRGSTY